MNEECATHEENIVKRVSTIIDDKIEYKVSKKMTGVMFWLIGSVFSVFTVLIVFFISNSNWQGRMEERANNQMKLTSDFISEQRRLNEKLTESLNDMDKSYSYKMNVQSSNLKITMYNMKRLDPEFIIPDEIILRGEIIKSKEQ